MLASSDIGQINPLSITFITMTLLICAAALIGVCIWGKRKYRVLFSFFSVFAGVAGCFTSLLLLGGLGFLVVEIKAAPWLLAIVSAVFTALAAGISRFVIFLLMKQRRDFTDGLAFGIGFGGTELILSVGMTLIMYYMFISVSGINTGTWGSFIQGVAETSKADADYYTQFAQMLANKAPVDYLVFGLDGLCKLIVQIALSLLVLSGFTRRKKWQYLAVAILIHSMVAIAYAFAPLINQWVAEGLVLVLAAASVLYIIKADKGWIYPDTAQGEQPKPIEQEDTP